MLFRFSSIQSADILLNVVYQRKIHACMSVMTFPEAIPGKRYLSYTLILTHRSRLPNIDLALNINQTRPFRPCSLNLKIDRLDSDAGSCLTPYSLLNFLKFDAYLFRSIFWTRLTVNQKDIMKRKGIEFQDMKKQKTDSNSERELRSGSLFWF